MHSLSGLCARTEKCSNSFWGSPISTEGLLNNFSQVFLPLHTLISSKKKFCWNQDQRNQPRTKEFGVEIDALNAGVGAVLSQREQQDNRIHPFSCSFLLAVNLAYEEWRHWLERIFLPLVVLINHRILEYLTTAKCLNGSQAMWALILQDLISNCLTDQYPVTAKLMPFLDVTTNLRTTSALGCRLHCTLHGGKQLAAA